MNAEIIHVFVAVIAVMVLIVYIKANTKICEPNEVMIFSDRIFKHKDKALGTKVLGYRVIRGGRAMQIPLIETVRTISLATMDPEEANINRLAVASQVAKAASEDMKRMGLVLDMFKIQVIKDNKGYLEAIARKKNAEVQRDARIVEAEFNAEASRKEAESRKLAEVAEIEAKKVVTASELEFRVKQAEWRAQANKAEERAKVAGEIARMEETTSLEKAKVETNKLKYQAEVIIPAEAEKEAKLSKAKGDAAFTFEEGKAKAEALKLLREQWQKEGSKELFMIQLLPELVENVSKIIASNLNIERLTVVDNGNGSGGGLPHLVGNLAGSVNSFFEQMKTLTGMDIARLIEEKCETSAMVKAKNVV